MADRLDVWYGAEHAGSLWQTIDGVEFEYSESWLVRDDAVALSRSLPLGPGRQAGRRATAFFENLLPEGEIRGAIARAIGEDDENEFRLLEGIGAECAGALSITSPGQTPPDTVPVDDLPVLESQQLEQILTELPQTQLVRGPDGLIQFSLAGAQDKLVLIDRGDDTWSLASRGVPSTHIIKTPIATLDDTVTNEAFCLELASRVGVPAAGAQVIRVGSNEAVAIERFDRRVDASGTVHRIHQEDICQALGIPSRSKYEKNHGPGIAECIEVLREVCTVPAREVTAFVRQLIFTSLIVNGDAHGKNYSVLMQSGNVRLSPAYDLVCTAVYQTQAIDTKLAMRVGRKDKIWSIYPSDWKRLAQAAGLGAGPVQQMVRDMADRMPRQANQLADEWRRRGDHRPVIDRIVEVIESSSRHVQTSFSAGGDESHG
jgi:serine/threonine-protein kinase HipA